MNKFLKQHGFIRMILMFSLIKCGEAFAPPSLAHNHQVSLQRSNKSFINESSMVLAAKKKRRRRKNQAPAAPAPISTSSGVDKEGDELPDFDLDPPSSTSGDAATTKKEEFPKAKADGSEITRAQMGRYQPLTNVKDLLKDRSLEQELGDDDKVVAGSEDLPSFSDYLRDGPSSAQPIGKKKQRQAERIAAATALREAEEAAAKPNSIAGKVLSYIPLLDFKEGDEVTFPKIIEALTWLGIFTLVLWEVYINSPFFERAAPMAPVVY